MLLQHQPLHAATLWSEEFPDSDYGGNLYLIAGVNQTELHAFWDSGAGQWPDDPARPLNASTRAWLDGWSNRITALYPQNSFPSGSLTGLNPWAWASESSTIAQTFVYTAPQAPTPLPAQYISQSQQVVFQQIAKGGYRLAALLESIFNPASPHHAVRLEMQAQQLQRQQGAAHTLRGGRN